MSSLARRVISGRVLPTSTLSSSLRPTTSRIAISLTSLSVASGSFTANRYFFGSLSWYCTAKRRSTRLTSEVSTRDLYSLEFTLATLTLVTVSTHGQRQPQPCWRMSTSLPKRRITPCSAALIWKKPLRVNTASATTASRMNSERLSLPRPPPGRNSDSSRRCQLLTRSSRSGPPP